MKRAIPLIVALSLIVWAFTYTVEETEEPIADIDSYESWGDYWYQGKAELTSYTLEQPRYGEIRDGEAVLIFVTEDFSRDKQVKLDNPYGSREEEKVKVLKLNHNRSFITGLYPYSLLSSVFTPVSQKGSISKTVKATASTQEWCGQTFSQINLEEEDYRVKSFSYFESEGDRNELIENGLLEDGLWNMIRIDPESIPMGKVQLIPSLFYTRLRHMPIKLYDAEISKNTVGEETSLLIEYKNIDRSLKINYSTTFPYEISGWEERYTSGFGSGKQSMTTKAVKKERILLDYWNYNSNDDESWRQKLGLTKK